MEPDDRYPSQERLIDSPGNTAYFVDPVRGDDANAGTSAAQAWKSIARINALRLAPGDSVALAPGFHDATLKPSGAGTIDRPVVIRFSPGRHVFRAEDALRRAYCISNSTVQPTLPRPIGILVENVQHLRLLGGGTSGERKTDVVFDGRMTMFVNDHADDVLYEGLTFDLQRPTVSEFRVSEVEPDRVVIRIAEGSTYAIDRGTFQWTGDIGPGWTLVQQATPEDGRCWRMSKWDPFTLAEAKELGERRVQLVYRKGGADVLKELQKGHQFQFRNVERDTVGAHNNRSRDLTFRDCRFYTLTGMGIVSQFTEHLTFQGVKVVPPEGTLRTCAAWADGFHFSGCRGEIRVEDCHFSGMQDDPINVHGTFLRIVRKTGEHQVLLRFMHRQTRGFAAFQPGDEVAVMSSATLCERPGTPRRKVTALAPLPGDEAGTDWLLTLDGPVPDFETGDVIDNLSWYPDLTIRGCSVTMDSCRGFLITTRGKVLVEGNTFNRCRMPGILIAGDAEHWFESGSSRDVTIRNNRFIGCGIEIKPENKSVRPEEPVHENIRIEDNVFDGGGISAKSVKGLTILNNRSPDGRIPISTNACTDVTAEKNDRQITK